MAARVRFTARARSTLTTLLEEIAVLSPTGARTLESGVIRSLDLIAQHPFSGASLSPDGDIRRILAAKRITLIYEIKADDVLIFEVAYAGHHPDRLRKRPTT